MTFEVKIEIFGRVQGVRFRHFIKRTANKLNIRGYVSNNLSGSVLVVAQGEKKKLLELIDEVQKGPLFAKVEGFSYNWRKKTDEFYDFKIISEKGFILDQKSSLVNLGKKIFGFGRIIPTHVVIIPDGNRRWAKFNGLEELEGHKKSGAYENLKNLLDEVKKLKISYFTLWGFSTENWKRSKKEIDSIFKLTENLLHDVENDLVNQKIRFRHLGRRDRLPKKLVEAIESLEEKTKNFSEYNLQICLDYGGRDEIVRAFNKALKLGVCEFNEDNLKNYMDSAGIPDPDLIIRTSGEKRLSGFMPYQSVYSEFYFIDIHFPDFKPEHLREAVEEFSKRKRRIGGN